MLVSDIHERIRELVLAKGRSRELTNTALAKLIGMKQAHISNFVNEKRGLSIAAMDNILGVLEFQVEDLLAPKQVSSPVEDKSDSENVPLVEIQAAMRPVISSSRFLGMVSYDKAFLKPLKPQSPERKSWLRFIAVKISSDSSDPMYPRFGHGAVCLIDRHYCSLRPYRKNVPNLYLVRKGDEYLIRQVEMQGTVICLRPENSNHPLDFIPISRKYPLESCIVGRVAQIAVEI